MGQDRNKENEDFLEFNENEYTAYGHNESCVKEEKFIALNTYIKLK